MVLGGTGSGRGGPGWFLVILGQYGAVLVGTWWHWVSIGWYWPVLGDTGSKHRGTGCKCEMLSENNWFTWSKPSNH